MQIRLKAEDRFDISLTLNMKELLMLLNQIDFLSVIPFVKDTASTYTLQDRKMFTFFQNQIQKLSQRLKGKFIFEICFGRQSIQFEASEVFSVKCYFQGLSGKFTSSIYRSSSHGWCLIRTHNESTSIQAIDGVESIEFEPIKFDCIYKKFNKLYLLEHIKHFKSLIKYVL